MKQLQFIHIQQRDESDCGAACLRSILKSFGGDASVEKIRELSGTTPTGTSMLGLYQAAQKLGMEAEGFEADIENLKTLSDPVILHILKMEELQHYVVLYQYLPDKNLFVISDPAEPYIQKLSPEELEKLWNSKLLLQVKKTDELQKASAENLWQSLRWMYEFTLQDLNLLFTSLILGVVISVLGLSLAIFSQKLIDNILPSGNASQLFIGAGLLLFLLLISIFFTYIRSLFLLRQSKDFNIRILGYFYQKLLYLPKSFFDTRKTGDLVARMNDTSRIQETIAILFSSMSIELIKILVSTAALFAYSFTIGWISLFWIPIFAFILFRFNKQIILAQRQLMSSYAMNESNYIDTIQGIGTLKVLNKEAYFQNLTKQYYSLFQQSTFNLGLVSLRFGTTAQTASTLFTIGLITYSAYLVFGGSISAGAIMAIIQLLGISMASVASLSGTYMNLQEAKVALDRMKEFTELEAEFHPEIDSTKKDPKVFEKLEIQNLDFRFIGHPLLLKDVSFEIKKGEMISILGESGCGKSTLLQIIQQFYSYENGNILLNGQTIESYSLSKWRNLIGVVPQQIKIYNGTLLDNITLSNPEDVNIEELEAMLKSYGFNDYFLEFPAGYSTILGETGIDLSGGQKQMVALARALYSKPQLLLLDEATSALDTNSEARILELLNALKKEMGILLVTHRIKTASMADYIYLIEDGTILHQGTHAELMAGTNFYSRAIYEWQNI